jgi:hypothetical protein
MPVGDIVLCPACDDSIDAIAELGKLRRVVRSQRELLELGLHALRAGRPHVTDEYVERAIESLRPI